MGQSSPSLGGRSVVGSSGECKCFGPTWINQNGTLAHKYRSTPGEQMNMDMADIQAMMDRIQELMEQGRMAEAQQALEELQQMMENLRLSENNQRRHLAGMQGADLHLPEQRAVVSEQRAHRRIGFDDAVAVGIQQHHRLRRKIERGAPEIEAPFRSRRQGNVPDPSLRNIVIDLRIIVYHEIS